ncbi:MAG: hypothetical protein ABR564_00135 [Candidatus Dormibacteria bacterium]
MNLGRGSTPSGPTADELRDRRLQSIKELAERFVFDLGLLMAGHPATLEEYVSAAAASRLRASLEPFLATGDAMRPNFGEYGELRVEGDLLRDDRCLNADVDFTDHSVRETSEGNLLPARRRRMRLTLTIDPDLRRIAEFRLQRLGTA